MLLAKQLQNINLNGIRNFNSAMQQVSNSSLIGISRSNLPNCMSKAVQLQACNGNKSTILSTNTSGIIAVRNHYRNYKHHPSRIVRAYRITRTWLTEHFVVGERRFENIYSFSFLVTCGIALIGVGFLNLQLGGESGGYDVDKTQKNKNDKQ